MGKQEETLRRVPLVALAAMLALAGVARAQNLEQQREWCEDVSDPDHAIDGCTAVIQSGTGSLEVQAVAFNNRGYAYSRKGQYDRAIADFDQAIRLDPEIVLAFINRGDAYAAIGQYQPRDRRSRPGHPDRSQFSHRVQRSLLDPRAQRGVARGLGRL